MEFTRALNNLPEYMEAHTGAVFRRIRIFRRGIVWYSIRIVWYSPTRRARGPTMRAILRSKPAQKMRDGIDHIDLPLYFDQIIVHRNF